jgi:hypothetical protein
LQLYYIIVVCILFFRLRCHVYVYDFQLFSAMFSTNIMRSNVHFGLKRIAIARVEAKMSI